MILCKFGFVTLFCLISQSNGYNCTIKRCQQNTPSDILQENLSLTTKLPNCTLARNYDGLTFSIVLENNSYQSCSWIFARSNFLDSKRNCVDYNRKNEDGSSSFNQENILTSFVLCTNRSSSRRDVRETTCVMNNRKKYSSIVFRNISFDKYFVSVQCDGKYTEGFHIRVRSCNATFGDQGNQVYVDSNSTDYNAAGSFRSNNNGTLIYSNGTILQDNSTRCLATAEWIGQTNLQCWKAPSVQLKGNYDWVNESKLTLQCEYNDGFPRGIKSIFYVKNIMNAILPKSETFNLTVDKTFNKIPVSCQAQTPFTQKNNGTGRSRVHFLNVLFAPYPLQGKCVRNLENDKNCEVEFFSNPNATFVSLFLEGMNITDSNDFSLSIGKNHSHIFRLNFTKSVKNNSRAYNLTVHSLVQPYFHHILFNITDELQVISTTTTAAATQPPNSALLIGIGVGIPLVILLLITIVFVNLKRKKQTEKNICDYAKESCEKEVVMNELYVSADNLQNGNDQKTQSSKKVNTEKKKKVEYKMVNKKKSKNPEGKKPSTDKPQQVGNVKSNEFIYGVVNKPKKKPQPLNESSEREEKMNELYVSTDMLDNKDTKLSTDEPQKAGNKIDVEVTYGVVNKPKKKLQNTDNKTKPKEKEKTMNELHTSANILDKKVNEKSESSTKSTTEKKKKTQKKTVNKKKPKSPEETKPTTEEPQQTANNKNNEVVYGVVNKPKKKPKTSSINEKPESATKTDAEKKKKAQNKVVNKKKAKKPEGSKPSSEESQQTENIKVNEVTYGVVNKPKKKPKVSTNANAG